MTTRLGRSVAVPVVACIALAGCGGSVAADSKAPKVVCGTTIRARPVYTNAVDATKPGTITVTKFGYRRPFVFVRLASGCAHGATVSVGPSGDDNVSVEQKVVASDHLFVAVSVLVSGRPAELVVMHPDGQKTYIRFDVPSLPVCDGGGPPAPC